LTGNANTDRHWCGRILLIGLGIFLFLRDRARLKEDEDEVREDGEEGSEEEVREDAMTAIALMMPSSLSMISIKLERFRKKPMRSAREDLKKRLEE